MVQDSLVVQLDAGTHWLCTCGESKNTPYCDGGHKGSAYHPLALTLEAPASVEISGSMKANVS